MEKVTLVSIHPDLVVNRESAIDRIGATASRSVDRQHPTYPKQIQLVRLEAKKLCSAYKNCRQEDWCWHCSSGQNGQPLFRPGACEGCKLLSADAALELKKARTNAPAIDGGSPNAGESA